MCKWRESITARDIRGAHARLPGRRGNAGAARACQRAIPRKVEFTFSVIAWDTTGRCLGHYTRWGVEDEKTSVCASCL